MKSLSKDDLELLKTSVTGAETPLGERPTSVADLLKEPASDWAASADGQAWAALLRASEAAMADGYRARLGEHLGRMSCRSCFADGAVAAALVRRALSQGFKGDLGAFHDRLKAADCPAAKTLPPRLLLDLAAAAEAARPLPPTAQPVPQ